MTTPTSREELQAYGRSLNIDWRPLVMFVGLFFAGVVSAAFLPSAAIDRVIMSGDFLAAGPLGKMMSCLNRSEFQDRMLAARLIGFWLTVLGVLGLLAWMLVPLKRQPSPFPPPPLPAWGFLGLFFLSPLVMVLSAAPARRACRVLLSTPIDLSMRLIAIIVFATILFFVLKFYKRI